MTFWIVENGELVEYRRLGECNKCGECCKHKSFTYAVYRTTGKEPSESKEKNEDWSAWEGYSVFWAGGMWWYFKPVKMFDKENICCFLKDGLCDIYADFIERPLICRFWPIHPDDLKHFPECGYKFERVDKTT